MDLSPSTTTPSRKNLQIKIPPPDTGDITVGVSARNEAVVYAYGKDLEDKKTANEISALERANKADSHLHTITVWYFYIIAIIGALSIFMVCWQLFTPISWHFLTDDQIVRIEEFLVSGGAGVFLDRASKKVK